MCAINTVAVLTIIVKPKPATAKGTAKAIAGPIPCAPWLPSIRIIAEATPAKAASGAIAAPTLAQPIVINCKLPPSITPSSS